MNNIELNAIAQNARTRVKPALVFISASHMKVGGFEQFNRRSLFFIAARYVNAPISSCASVGEAPASMHDGENQLTLEFRNCIVSGN
jgi:hypothetical protein